MIKTFIVDDEQPAIDEIEYLLSPYQSVEVSGKYEDPRNALGDLEKGRPDLLFLDIDMPHIKGIELALQIQERLEGATIVFVTAHSNYALEAFSAYPLDYILKPIDEIRFRQTMDLVLDKFSDRLRHRENKKEEIIIHCFGRFEIVRDEQTEDTLTMRSKKMKEIFAYLLQRFEKPVGRDELLDRFFSGHKDKKTINHLHVIIYKLRHTLESFGITREQILIEHDYLLKAAPGVCDYIDFVNFVEQHSTITGQNAREAEKILSSYRGAYLAEEDYHWAEDEREWLGNQYEKLHLKLAHYYAVNEEAVRAEETLLRLLNFDNLNEEGWQALLQLYLAHPDPTVQAKYLSVYERYSRMLTREFGTEPEERFKKHYLKMI